MLSVVHPIHDIIGMAIVVILSALGVIFFLFVFFWAIVGIYRRAFLPKEPEPEFVKSQLAALPLGAPRDGGNYIYTGHGWERLTDEEAEQVRANLKYDRRLKVQQLDEEGWDVLAPETEIMPHPDMVLEVVNDADGDFDEADEEEAQTSVIFS